MPIHRFDPYSSSEGIPPAEPSEIGTPEEVNAFGSGPPDPTTMPNKAKPRDLSPEEKGKIQKKAAEISGLPAAQNTAAQAQLIATVLQSKQGG